MIQKNKRVLVTLLVFTLAILIGPHAVSAEDIPRISKEEARDLLNDPNVVFLDLRSGSDWRASDQKLPGAVHVDARNWKEWVSRYDPGKTYILYCA